MENQVKPVRCLLAGIGHGWLHCIGHALLPNAPCRTSGEARIWNPEIILKVALEWGNLGTWYLSSLPSLGSLYVVQTYTQCNQLKTNLVNQLIQLTPEEHGVFNFILR